MSSSIIFLGTAGDSFVLGRQLRASGGIILNVGENQFHIDPGPGALSIAKLCGVNIRANTAVFVSHAHIIHSNDINAVVDAMTYRGFDRKGVVIANKTVVSGDEGYEQRLFESYKKCLERVIVLREGQRVGVNEIEVEALKCRHSDPNAIGFKFYTPKFNLTYTGDTSYNPDLLDQYRNSNIIILNVTNPTKKDSKDHLSCEDAVKIIKEVKPRLAIITHFGIKMIEADPLYLVREIQKETGVQVVAAKDGMVINPVSYAIDKGQRTLFAYPKKKEVEVTEIKSEGKPEEQEDTSEQEELNPEGILDDESEQIPDVKVEPYIEEENQEEESSDVPSNTQSDEINDITLKSDEEEIQKKPGPETHPKETKKEYKEKELLGSNKTLKDIFLEESDKE